MAYETISIEDAKVLIQKYSAKVIDIRDQTSFDAGHIAKAIHVSNENIEDFIANADQEKPLIVCCYHGNMSKGAADYLNSRGFGKTYSLNGGYTEWAMTQSAID